MPSEKFRAAIKFGGESGQGINTVGKLLSKSLEAVGFKVFAYREYPSLIQGGVASYQIDFSNEKINSSKKFCDILAVFEKDSFHEYLHTLSPNGILIYEDVNTKITEEDTLYISQNGINMVHLDTKSLVQEFGGTPIMSNAITLGFLWKILSLDENILVEEITKFFSKKNIDMEAEKRCILGGYNYSQSTEEFSLDINTNLELTPTTESMVLTGNDAIVLGAISAGVRAYYGYPMTPATSIFKLLGNTANETGILVKQAENEITAAQMALGSMYMGARALVATSGGGFDLMIETISCAGMSETPLVIVLSQRTGSGTGVPTWTGAGDLNTAVRSGHGEFPRCVIAVSDIDSCYLQIQHAFNISEKYQLPVILLTEKQISESLSQVEKLPEPLEIKRGLQYGENRYEITETGISPRWLPSKDLKPYLSTSDEHLSDGTSTENSKDIMAMTEKRMRKLEDLRKNIPEPVYYGPTDAKQIFLGWGSVKNTVLDLLTDLPDVGYLHYEYIYPLKTDFLKKLIEEQKELILLENNFEGQLGKLITENTGYIFTKKLLKYDARPFFVEDILDYIKK